MATGTPPTATSGPTPPSSPARRTHAARSSRSPLRRALDLDVPWLGGRGTAPWVVLAIVVVLVLAVLGSLVFQHRSDTIDYNVRTYQVVSDTEVRVSFDISKAPLAEAQCDVQAVGRDGSVVGELPAVVVGPRRDSRRVSTVSVVVPTRQRAVDADVPDCRITRTR